MASSEDESMFVTAARCAASLDSLCVSNLQRRLNVSYQVASGLMERMVSNAIVVRYTTGFGGFWYQYIGHPAGFFQLSACHD